MSVVSLTKSDLVHVKRMLAIVGWLLDEYPELVTTDEEDEYRIVKQLLEEKLNEDIYI